VDEQRPEPDESFDDDEYVTGWWQRQDHLSAGRLKAARALDWAFEGIHDHMLNADPESNTRVGERHTRSTTRVLPIKPVLPGRCHRGFPPA
jgi:hypothetical protein